MKASLGLAQNILINSQQNSQFNFTTITNAIESLSIIKVFKDQKLILIPKKIVLFPNLIKNASRD